MFDPDREIDRTLEVVDQPFMPTDLKWPGPR